MADDDGDPGSRCADGGELQVDHREVHRFRRVGYQLFMAGVAGVFALAWSSFIGEGEHPENAVAAVRVCAALVTLASSGALVGFLRMGVIAKPGGLTIRNLVRRHHLQWDEIAAFRPPVGYGAFRRTGLQVVLRNDAVVYAALYSRGPFNSETFALDVVAQLESLRLRWAAG